MKHRGDLKITSENLWRYQELTEVSGSVDISAENASLPALTKSGSVDIRAENASLPALTEVSGYVFAQPSTDIAQERLVEVARHALATPKSLYMRDWHHCKTSHCIAGWAIHLAGEEGYALERQIGPGNAGLVLLGPKGAELFHLSYEAARAKLQAVLA